MDVKTVTKIEEKTFAEVLALLPPGKFYNVPDFALTESKKVNFTGAPLVEIIFPVLEMYCNSTSCQGFRFFDPIGTGNESIPLGFQNTLVTYICRNCKKNHKIFALRSNIKEVGSTPLVTKIGEHPFFGPHTPGKLITLVGPDKDYFLQGRRAENLGLGIGAFAYYRRVVENQKGRLIREIAKVAKRLGAAETILEQFAKAEKETQFSRAIDDIKGAIPQSLLIQGQNPLRLLHGALSEGIHAQSDAECLEIASSIRIVLAELAERIAIALKEESELTNAVNRLLQPSKSNTALLTSNNDDE